MSKQTIRQKKQQSLHLAYIKQAIFRERPDSILSHEFSVSPGPTLMKMTLFMTASFSPSSFVLDNAIPVLTT